MKGGYFILDCRNHQPAGENTILTITDEEFKKDFIAAGKSGKPVLFTNFRTGCEPTFGMICRSDTDIKGSVLTTLGPDFRYMAYVWVYDKSVDELLVVMKIHTLTN